MLVPDIREKLRRSGYTLTSQRRAVLEALSKAKGHPSAEDVYLIVKRENPRVALGTVYQALSVLEEVGVIGSKHWAESPTRYDLNVDPHLDIRCIRCGEVSEVPGVALGGVEETHSQQYSLQGHPRDHGRRGPVPGLRQERITEAQLPFGSRLST